MINGAYVKVSRLNALFIMDRTGDSIFLSIQQVATFAFIWSSCVEIGFSGFLSLLGETNQISTIHPNPLTDSELYVSLNQQTSPFTISIFDFQGRLFFTEQVKVLSNDNQIIIHPELASGVYLVRIYLEKLNAVEYHKLLNINELIRINEAISSGLLRTL